jgi:glycogen synthase
MWGNNSCVISRGASLPMIVYLRDKRKGEYTGVLTRQNQLYGTGFRYKILLWFRLPQCQLQHSVKGIGQVGILRVKTYGSSYLTMCSSTDTQTLQTWKASEVLDIFMKQVANKVICICKS